MKFPAGYCIPTSLLTYKTYPLFIEKLKAQGYKTNIEHLSFTLVQSWEYLGVIEYHEEIETYSAPMSFMGVNDWLNYTHLKDEEFPNIWTKAKLDKYLGVIIV